MYVNECLTNQSMGRILDSFCEVIHMYIAFTQSHRRDKQTNTFIIISKVVINSLVLSLPAIGNVVLVCMVFWLIFSIMGYQFFGGKFYRCIDRNYEKYDHSVIENKKDCLANATVNGNRWVNSKIHFNSALTGFLALFQVVRYFLKK